MFATSRADSCSAANTLICEAGNLRICLSLSFEMMKPVHWAELKLGGLMDHRLRLVFGQVPQNICLYLWWTKTWHLGALDLQRGTLFYNVSVPWLTLSNHWFSLCIVAEINGEEWLAEMRLWVFHHCEISPAWSWLSLWTFLGGIFFALLPLYHSVFLLSARERF